MKHGPLFPFLSTASSKLSTVFVSKISCVFLYFLFRFGLSMAPVSTEHK